MAAQIDQPDAGVIPRRLRFLNGGFLNPGLRRMLRLAGYELRPGLPRPDEGVIVWGRSPYAGRGEWAAARAGVPLIRAEDAFLRSVLPGRVRGRAGGGTPLGLLLDPLGLHFDAGGPSRIEHLLAAGPTTDPALLARADEGIARLRHGHLTKYTGFDPAAPLPDEGFVLVVDQTAGDASIRHGGAGAVTFAAMLAAARADHPGKQIALKTHPETARGLRPGHFSRADLRPGDLWIDGAVSPWVLLDRAAAVYVVTSQLGYEAILAGHRPVVFGQPFYAGWGLSDDRAPTLPRRGVTHSPASIFAVSHLRAPVWVSPCLDRLLSFEEACDQLEAETRAWREDRSGYVGLNMRLWKRRFLQDFFGRVRPMTFAASPAQAAATATAQGRRVMVWGSAPAPDGAIRLEDGFLRSRGLGAALVPPVSLIADPTGGAYYDPAAPSAIEAALARPLPPGGAARALRLAQAIAAAAVSKYNLPGQPPPDLPAGHRILVPGQVEDDASIRLGAGTVRRNLDLLRAARAAHPQSVLIYKPHPDVEAGLRPGAIAPADLAGLADVVAAQADPLALLSQVDAVWTITSTLGFEALLRGVPVTCLGAPFYAGYGLTEDRGPVPDRRAPAPLAALIHAALIAAPRYLDPVTGRPCPPEVIVARLASGAVGPRRISNRLLAKAQGALAGFAWLWRR